MTKCKACGASIEFISTPTGKKLPVDAFPVNYIPGKGHGKFVDKDGIVHSGTQVGDSCEYGYFIGHVPHWATCTQADKFRRG